MLVLSRKVGESITIGNDIVVYIRHIKGGRVTVGIEAPEQVRVLRGELPPSSSDSVKEQPLVNS